MAEKHFELTGETKTIYGQTFHQIRALKDLPEHYVKAGDIGGWIEKLDNLNDNAWITQNAYVGGSARVGDYAYVGDYADISKTWHYLQVGAIGSESVTATLYRTKGGGHRLDVGCWVGGTLGTLMAEVKRRRKQWNADEATQKIWFEQYRALKRLGKATVKRWTETEPATDATDTTPEAA